MKVKKTPVLAWVCISFVLTLCVSCATGDVDKSSWPQPDQQPIAQSDAGPPVPTADSAPPPPPKDSGTSWPQQDSGTPPLQDSGTPPPKDSGTPPPPPKDSGSPTTLTDKVAAIQYGEGQAASVKSTCTSTALPDVCALLELVVQAQAKGASYIVLPEYATGQQAYEPTPTIGDNPATNSAWPSDMIIKIFSLQAKKLGVYLVLNLLTWEGTQANPKKFNTSIAFDPAGKVVGVHRKFNLFGKEGQTLTAGQDVSVFQTPLGKMGLLICADIYGSTTLNNKLAYTLNARVVAVSSYWTVSNPVNTWYKSYLGKYPYYSIIANTTHSPGYGGGVFKTPWAALDVKIGTTPTFAIATIPKN